MGYQQNNQRQGGGGGWQNRQALAVSPQSMEIAKQGQGKFESLDRLAAAMDAMAATCNVLTPVSRVAAVPQGHAVTLSVVTIDPEQETYSVDGGKRALSKSALDKVAAAAGITWDPRQSGRLDDRSDPHYCHFRAVGTLKDLDGSERTISGECEMDLRDGSPTVSEMERQAKSKGRDATGQVSQIRAFILRHAESKAKNRAIRQGLGVRSSYKPEDLARPFVAPKLVFTGDFGDPEINRGVAVMMAAKALGFDGATAAAALFGPPRPGVTTAEALPPQGALPEGPRHPQLAAPRGEVDLTGPAQHSPPPVSTVRRVDRDEDDDGEGWGDDDVGPGPHHTDDGEPIPFGDLNDESQVAELLALMARKGKGGAQNETWAKQASRDAREGAYAKLCALPDSGDPIGF